MAAYTGTPRTWTAGETVTAALMNSDVRDPLAALAGAWTSYTPTLSQGASTNIAKTTTYAKYIRVGKLVICTVKLVPSGTGTSGSAVTITLPVTAATSGLMVGTGRYIDQGTATYIGAAMTSATTTVEIFNAATGLVGVNPALAVASTDEFYVNLTYEAA